MQNISTAIKICTKSNVGGRMTVGNIMGGAFGLLLLIPNALLLLVIVGCGLHLILGVYKDLWMKFHKMQEEYRQIKARSQS